MFLYLILAKFEPFLKSYYDKYKYESITSDDFKVFFLEYFDGEPKLSEIQWNEWFHSPGMPVYKPQYDDSLAVVCKALVDRWLQWDENSPIPFETEDLKLLSSGQVIEFLSLLLIEKPLRYNIISFLQH